MRELERQLFHAERLTTVGRLAAGIAHEINNPLEGMSNYLTLARDALARGDVEAAVAPRGLGEAGPRPGGGDRAPGPGPRRPRQGPADAGGPQPGPAGDRAVRAVAQGVRPRGLRPRPRRRAARRARQPRHAGPGRDEPDRERLRGAAGEGRGPGDLAARRAPTWWRSSPTGAPASRRPTASGSSSPSSRPRTRRASGSRSVIPSCGSTTGSWTSRRGRAGGRSSACGCRHGRLEAMNDRTASRGRVLVVEDEAYVRDSLVEILRARRFDASAAGSVAEALAHLGRAPVDVVLSDLRMPGADGLELVRRMQTRGARRAGRHPHRPRQRRLRRRVPEGGGERLHPEAGRARGARGGPRPRPRGARAAPRGALPAERGRPPRPRWRSARARPGAG